MEGFDPDDKASSVGQKFPKKLKLNLRSDFIHLRERGKKFTGTYLFMVMDQGSGSETKFAVSVSRKVGGAVKRNRLKRRIREIFRKRKEAFPGGKHILVGCRKGAAELDYHELEREIFGLLEKIRK